MRPSDEEIMAVIRAKPGLRMGEIMRELGIEETSANKARMVKSITSLKKWKFIEPIDDIRPTRWKEYGVDVDVPIRKLKRVSIKKCREYGMDYSTVCSRLDGGWSEEEALTLPVGVRRKSKEKTFTDKCREHGMEYKTVHYRIHRLGWTEEEALNTPVGVRRKSRGESLMDKCREHGMKHWAVWYRIHKLGWSEEKALTTPIRRYKHDSTE